MSIEGQGHSLTLVKGHSDFKVKCLTFGLYTQVSDSGPLGPLVFFGTLRVNILRSAGGWSGGVMVLGKLPVQGLFSSPEPRLRGSL